MSSEEEITTTTASIEAGVVPSHVLAVIYAGKIKARKCEVSGKWMISRASFEHWSATRKKRKLA